MPIPARRPAAIPAPKASAIVNFHGGEGRLSSRRSLRVEWELPSDRLIGGKEVMVRETVEAAIGGRSAAAGSSAGGSFETGALGRGTVTGRTENLEAAAGFKFVAEAGAAVAGGSIGAAAIAVEAAGDSVATSGVSSK
jgi:hypothetical protein